MGNELALDVNVICLLILSLFFVVLVTALTGPVVAGVSYVGLWFYGLTKGRAEIRRAQAEALEAEAAAAAVSAAEAVMAAAHVRLLPEHPRTICQRPSPRYRVADAGGRRLSNPEVPT